MDKKLLTPGPLTTSLSTKEAMLHDWGSRDKIFIDLNHSNTCITFKVNRWRSWLSVCSYAR